jgi:hypothetical protein
MDAGTVLRWLAKAAGLAVLIWYSRVWERECTRPRSGPGHGGTGRQGGNGRMLSPGPSSVSRPSMPVWMRPWLPTASWSASGPR